MLRLRPNVQIFTGDSRTFSLYSTRFDTRGTMMKARTIVIHLMLLHVNCAVLKYENSSHEEMETGISRLVSHLNNRFHEKPSGYDNEGSQHIKPDQPRFCVFGNPCGDENQCCCEGDMASCAGEGLTKIPPLPTTITWLDFSNNSLRYIDQHTLQNVTSVNILRLDTNHLTSVHPKAFAFMKRLRVLKIGDNGLTDFKALMSALVYADELEHLNANSNQFHTASLSLLPALPTLKTLLLSANKIASIDKGEAKKQSHLQMFDISSNLLALFPDFCLNETQAVSFLPDLHTLNVEWNVITIMDPDSAKCLPNLQKLNLGGNAIRHIRSNFLQGFPRLENLTLNFCMTKSIDSSAFNHSNLKHLNVSENLWFFDSQHGPGISPGLFQYMPQLQFLDMSWTVFQYSQMHERHVVLSSISHVKEFALRGVNVDFIPREILQKFTDLTSLDFAFNQIPFLADDTFKNLTSLRSLDLRGNHLTTVSQSLLGDIVSRPNASINLSDNPFSCTCDLLWFIERYQEDYRRKKGDRIFSGEMYKCVSPDSKRNTALSDVDITRQTCALTRDAYIAILVVITFILVLLIVGSIIYKYRWQVRFMLYTLQHRLSRNSATRRAPHVVYDVFVSYDSSDSRWVVDTLIPELEGQRGLRLCVHERDFTPGMFITHNIIEKMEESGTIVPVLSNAYMTSDWCRFELFLALKNALRRPRPAGGPAVTEAEGAGEEEGAGGEERRIAILPVLLEDLRREGLDSLLCALLNTTTYLAWPQQGGRGDRERFWTTLSSVVRRSRDRELRDRP